MPSVPVRKRSDHLPQEEKTVKSEFNKDRIDKNGRFKPNEDDLAIIAALEKKFGKRFDQDHEDHSIPCQQPWL